VGQSSETKKLLRDRILNFGPESHNFAVFKLWPTKLCGLVGPFKAFPQMSKHVNQSSPISRKSKYLSEFDSPKLSCFWTLAHIFWRFWKV